MFMCIYRPSKQNNQYFLENLSSIPGHYSRVYDNYIFLGDFNMETNCHALTSFMQLLNFFNLIKTNTCFKGKGHYIELILAKGKYWHSPTFEAGLSDHHHLVYSILKTCFKREESKHFIYHDYKNFNEINFRMELENKLQEYSKHWKKFKKTFVNVVGLHIPRKTKVLRGNHKPPVDKNFSEAIVKHSKFKNKANRTKLQDDIIKYEKQRNLIVKLRGAL